MGPVLFFFFFRARVIGRPDLGHMFSRQRLVFGDRSETMAGGYAGSGMLEMYQATRGGDDSSRELYRVCLLLLLLLHYSCI